MTHSRRGLFGLLAGAAMARLAVNRGAGVGGLTPSPIAGKGGQWIVSLPEVAAMEASHGRNDLSPAASDDLDRRLAAWAGAVA